MFHNIKWCLPSTPNGTTAPMSACLAFTWKVVDTIRSKQNDHLFANDILKATILLYFDFTFHQSLLPWVKFNNEPALVYFMAWFRTRYRHISEPMVVQFNEALMCHSNGKNESFRLVRVALPRKSFWYWLWSYSGESFRYPILYNPCLMVAKYDFALFCNIQTLLDDQLSR